MESLVTSLQSYFQLSKNQAEKMSQFFVKETVKKDSYYLKTQQLCERLSFIESGYLRIYREENNKKITQWISGPQDFITELSSFLFLERSRYTIQAVNDSDIYSINKQDYSLLHNHIKDWKKIEYKFLSTCFITLENRVFSHLSMTAEQRYDSFYAQNKTLFNHVPLHYIASLLGMSPETLSRIRQKKS